MLSITAKMKTIKLGCICLLLMLPAAGDCQTPSTTAASALRLTFDQARRLVAATDEGNLLRQPGRYTRTRLNDGRVVEIYYPLTGGARATRHGAPGYGLIYRSEEAYRETIRPRHVLEDLLPAAQDFISRVPQLIRQLERRLRLAPGQLELNRAGLRRIDRYLRRHHATHSTAETDPALFQELTACYGETVRRAVSGHWSAHEEQVSPGFRQTEPNIVFGSDRKIKPWTSIIRALHDEDYRGTGLATSFDSDIGVGN